MEKFIVKVFIAGVLVLVFVAVVTMGGCGTLYGLGKDISGAAKGMAQSGHEVTSKE